MQTETWRQIAEQAGLAEALHHHPEDVQAAATAAATAAAGIAPITDPTAEPWPPMRPASCNFPAP